jgi:septum formation protein
MRELSQREINTYVDKNWQSVKNSVGGYLIESTGKKLFKTIHGDYFSALGLPIIELLNFLISKKAVNIV